MHRIADNLASGRLPNADDAEAHAAALRRHLKDGTDFLRGVGLPDNLIDYLPSLLNQPIQFYSCFISYSSKDQEFADRLHADLQNKGVRCWFAPHDMPIGAKSNCETTVATPASRSRT